MKLFFAIIALTVWGGLSVHAGPPAGYRLVWSDEFDGTALDTNLWYYRTGARLLSFQQAANVAVSDGLLRLALKKEDQGGLHYTAGGVISKKQFTYGYFEARFRCPASAGWHTSFWTMHYIPPTGSKDYAEQVASGRAKDQRTQEIDICEQDAVNHRSYSAGVMDWSRSKPINHGRVYYHDPTVPDFAESFHVWACEFTPTAVRFFLDGKLTHQADATKFPHGPQNVWLTSVAALFGSPKPPKQMDDSGLPAFAVFDWVRVYANDQAR